MAREPRRNLCVRVDEIKRGLELYRTVAKEKRGRVVFIAGFPGSGRSATLRALRTALYKEKPRPILICGHFSPYGQYEAWQTKQTIRVTSKEVTTLVAEILPWASTVGGLLGMSLGTFLSQLLKSSFAAWEFATSLHKRGESLTNSPDSLKRVLREATLKSAVVCILDDFDMAEGSWWRDLLLTFATEISVELPLLLFISVEGQGELGEHEPNESDCMYLARRLSERNLAHWYPLLPLSRQEISEWIGYSETTLTERLCSITSGNPKWVMQLWEDWSKRGVVKKDEHGKFSLSPIKDEQTSGILWDIIGHRLENLLPTRDISLLDKTIRLLSCAALEGRQFTVQALAMIFNWDPDELMDFLDSNLLRNDLHPDGLLDEVGFVKTSDPHKKARNLFRYAFTSDLIWMTLNHYGLTPAEATDLALELGRILASLYEPEERKIARTLARLYQFAGDLEAAARYQKMADFSANLSTHRIQAQLIIASNKHDWDTWDFSRAVNLLLEAGMNMLGSCPHTETLTVFKGAYKIAHQLGLYIDQAIALYYEGWVLHSIGDDNRAKTLAYKSLEILREREGNKRLEARCICLLGSIERCCYNYVMAQKMLQESIGLLLQTKDRRGEASSRWQLGLLSNDLGRYDQVQESIQRLIVLERETVDTDSMEIRALRLYLEGMMNRNQGEYEIAQQIIRESLDIWNELGNLSMVVDCLRRLGTISTLQGEPKAAIQYYLKLLELSQEIGERSAEAESWELLGVSLILLGRRKEGTRFRAMGYIVWKSIRAQHAERILRDLLQSVSEFQYGEHEVRALIDEVQAIYAIDRGRSMLSEYLQD